MGKLSVPLTIAAWAVPLAVWCWWNLPEDVSSWGLLVILGAAVSLVFGTVKFLKEFVPTNQEEKLKEMVWGIATSVLTFLWTPSKLLFIVIGIGVVVSLFIGSLQVDFRQRAQDADVYVFREGGTRGDPKTITKSSRSRFLRFTCLWPLIYKVQAEGYPEVSRRIIPWYTPKVVVPDHVERPVVLLRPTFELHDVINSHHPQVELTITVGEYTDTLSEYHGEAVWIGCADVTVPAGFVNAWQAAATVPHRQQAVEKWKNPSALKRPFPHLQETDVIQAKLKMKGQHFKDYQFKLPSAGGSGSFIHERPIDAD